VSDFQCFSSTELPTRDWIAPESDDSDRMTGQPEGILKVALMGAAREGRKRISVRVHPFKCGKSSLNAADEDDRINS
jgi:hypothetical protein